MQYSLVSMFGWCSRTPKWQWCKLDSWLPSHLRIQTQVAKHVANMNAKVTQCHHLHILTSGRRQVGSTRRMSISKTYPSWATSSSKGIKGNGPGSSSLSLCLPRPSNAPFWSPPFAHVLLLVLILLFVSSPAPASLSTALSPLTPSPCPLFLLYLSSPCSLSPAWLISQPLLPPQSPSPHPYSHHPWPWDPSGVLELGKDLIPLLSKQRTSHRTSSSCLRLCSPTPNGRLECIAW